MRSILTRPNPGDERTSDDVLAGLRPPARRFKRALHEMAEDPPAVAPAAEPAPERPLRRRPAMEVAAAAEPAPRRWFDILKRQPPEGTPAAAAPAVAPPVLPPLVVPSPVVADAVMPESTPPQPAASPTPAAAQAAATAIEMPMAPAAVPMPAEVTGSVRRWVNELLAAMDATAAILMAGLFVIAVVIVMGAVPWQQNADDLLPSIISLQKLTLYYWEQNRFGNLLPLLTAWIQNPGENAYVQILLRVAAGMVAPVFFTALFFRKAKDVWRAALAADCLMLVAASPMLIHETFIVATPYATSLCCAGLAVLVLRRAWSQPAGWQRQGLIALGTTALLAAHIVNYGLLMIALPLLAVLTMRAPTPERVRLLLLTCATALVALLLPAMFASQYPTSMAIRLSLEAMEIFLAEVLSCAGLWFIPAIALPIGLSWLASRQGAIPRSPRPMALLAAASGIAAFVLFLLAASSEHVMLNSYSPRYFVPAFLMLLALGGIGIWQSLRQIIPTRAVRDALFVLIAMLMLIGSRGRLAGDEGPTTDIIGWNKAQLAHAVATRHGALSLDGIAGTYWDTWPSVFAAMQLNYNLGRKGADVIGIAKRGAVRRDAFIGRLATQGKLRVGCIDMTPKNCLELINNIMEVQGLRATAFATTDPILEGHTLSYAEITAGR